MRDREGARMLRDDVLASIPGARMTPDGADDLVEAYFCWQDAAVVVASAYELWRVGQPADRALAFSAYHAALDLEEHAARVFDECVGRVFGRDD
jgi:hypothetical protein